MSILPYMLHVLLTRFNIASPGREVAIRNSPGWLDRRFELFEQYCLPSIAGQQNSDFHWFIYFDSATPDLFHDRIKAAQAVFPFEARFVDMFDKRMIARDVKSLARPGEDLIVTTRLDNDDAVSRDFVARVQAAARDHEAGTVLNFTHGIAMSRGRLYTAQDNSNPFTSLVETDLDNVETIWAQPHHLLEVKWRIRQVVAPPVWLQVVHGENVTNRIKGRLVTDTGLISAFPLREDVAAMPVSAPLALLDGIVLSPWRQLRERAFKFVKPLVLKLRPN